MKLNELIDDVQDLLEDPGGLAAFSDSRCTKAAESACRELGNRVGRNEIRFAIDMVADQAEYEFPSSFEVRRIEQVRILPENGSEPRRGGLIQIDLFDLPLTETESSERDPDRFVLNLTGGSIEDRYSLTLWPTPSRSADDTIVVDAEIDYVFEVADQLTINVPYPPQFKEALKNLTAYYLLMSKENATDQEQAMRFFQLGVTQISENRPVDAISKTVSCRSFP